MVEDRDNPGITEALAALAQTYFEMGDEEAEVRSKLLAQWQQLGRPSGVFAAAARSIKDLPQPVSEPAEKAERLQFFYDMLGVTTPAAALAAALRGREVLENLAAEFG